jgi:hypothetical protein
MFSVETRWAFQVAITFCTVDSNKTTFPGAGMPAGLMHTDTVSAGCVPVYPWGCTMRLSFMPSSSEATNAPA